MDDIIERAEALLDQDRKNWLWPIVRDLIAELKSARAELDRLNTDLNYWTNR